MDVPKDITEFSIIVRSMFWNSIVFFVYMLFVKEKSFTLQLQYSLPFSQM